MWIVALVLGSAVTLAVAGCSNGAATKTPTASDAPSASAVSEGTVPSTGTSSTPPTNGASPAPAITVLPNGEAVDGNGAPVPPEEPTQAALTGAATAARDPGTTDAPAKTPPPPATDAPLCVSNPAPGCSTPPPVSTAIVPDAQGIVIDSDPSTPAVDSSPINAASGQPFNIGIDIATAPQPYEGYEWDLVVDGPISFVTSDQAKPVGLTLCGATTHVGAATANEYYGGCLSTEKNLTYTGLIETVTLQCTALGAGQLHLRKQNAGSPFGTDLLNSSAQPITGDVGPAVPVNCS